MKDGHLLPWDVTGHGWTCDMNVTGHGWELTVTGQSWTYLADSNGFSPYLKGQLWKYQKLIWQRRTFPSGAGQRRTCRDGDVFHFDFEFVDADCRRSTCRQKSQNRKFHFRYLKKQ